MKAEIILFKQKNKHLYIRITEYMGNRLAVQYVANSLGIVNQHYNENLTTVVNKTIKDIEKEEEHNRTEPETLKALKWLKQQLYESLQPKLF